MYLYIKTPKKRIKSESLPEPAVTFGMLHTKMYLLISHTICESLVEIQQFKYKWLSIMFKNNQKT